MDNAKLGTGRICLIQRYSEPTVISGIDTRFTNELKVGYSIVLPSAIADSGIAAIVEIRSDVELVIAKEFKDLRALQLLTDFNGTSFKYFAPIDQSELYQTVFDRLNEGGAIGVFPEGGSHDRAEMLPLKGISSSLLPHSKTL